VTPGNALDLSCTEEVTPTEELRFPDSLPSLIVTAEPYFAVRMPSQLVVLENEVRKGTKGKIFIVDNYQLMKKAQYQKKENPLALTMDLKNVPLQMYEARNAYEIAALSEAAIYAPEIFSKAEASLKMAEGTPSVAALELRNTPGWIRTSDLRLRRTPGDNL